MTATVTVEPVVVLYAVRYGLARALRLRGYKPREQE